MDQGFPEIAGVPEPGGFEPCEVVGLMVCQLNRLRLRRSVSIIIPAFNEERRLPSTLRRVKEYLSASSWEFSEIVVVDDGSRDDTAEVAEAVGARVLRNPGNCGKGYSVRHGIMEAKGSWILFSDADLSAPIEELEALWRAAESEGALCAIGSRAVDRSLIGVHQPVFRESMGRVFNLLMRLETGLPFRDTQCGFKLFEASAAREIFRRQRLDGFGFDVEVLFIAKRLGYRTLEVPVRWNDKAGSKVSMFLGAKGFLDPLRVRWNGLTGRYDIASQWLRATTPPGDKLANAQVGLTTNHRAEER
jgi:glycosyltransferase involved in cell wall biosynthesis